mgnify:CR=1 FL=1
MSQVDVAADRGNKRNGRAAVEHRCDELGMATGAHANAQTGSDGTRRLGRRPGCLLAECFNAREKVLGVNAHRKAITSRLDGWWNVDR